MKNAFALLSFSLVLTSLSPAALSAEMPLKLLHLSFEDDQWVEFSKSGSELYCDYPNLVKGRKGNGASVSRTGETGVIEAADNIDQEQGTISFWYKPGAETSLDQDYGLFSSDSMIVWLWRHAGGRLRFDVSPKIYGVTDASQWKPGKWVHVTCTWDHTKGIEIYVDGELKTQKEATWGASKTNNLTVGLRTHRTGTDLANGVFDEFIIYDRPLTPAQVTTAYQGMLTAQNAAVAVEAKESVTRVRIFKLSFDEGFSADVSAGEPSPEKTREPAIELVEGFKGKAARFGGKDSLLRFSGPGNILSSQGTISLWMKLNWEPSGNGFPVSKVDNEAEGLQHQILAIGGVESRINFAMSNFARLESSSGRMAAAVNRQVLANTWHHYVLTWDTNTSMGCFYLDGKTLGVSTQFAFFKNPFDRIILGSWEMGIDGVLDEVSIYNFPFSHAEVMAHYSEEAVLSVDLLDYAMFVGKSNPMRLKFTRDGKDAITKSYQLDVQDATGQSVLAESVSVSVEPNSSFIKSFTLIPIDDGLYRVNLSIDGQQMKSFEIVAINEAELHPQRPAVAPGQAAKMTLLETIDCTRNCGEDKYRDDSEVSVKRAKVGDYREAQDEACSGFAYRIEPLPNPGRPHWLEIIYPDDATRTFMVAVFQEKDDHVDAKGLDAMGVITGGDHPITGAMQTKRMLFWPDSENIMVGCYNYKKYEGNAGPALAEIKVYENDGPLPRRTVGDLAGTPPRSIGLWQEDPGMPAYAWFNQDRMHSEVKLDSFWKDKWNRTVAYLDYSGQNLWNLMVTDYYGDTGLNSNQIPTSWRLSQAGRVPGWADLGALTLDSKGVVFYASLNGRISNSGSMGATAKMIPEENRRKRDDMLEILRGDKLIVDCIGADDYYTGSYNPLNPVVQAGYARQVRLYAEKFGRYKNFGGVHYLATRNSSLYFHDLRQGYGDWNIKRFSEETGVEVPIGVEVRRRFSGRYQWLMANARSEWTQWRTGKIREFYKSLAAIIREYNPNAKLLISMRVPDAFSGDWPSNEHAMADYWRGCGVDFDLFRDDSDVVLMQAITPHRARIYGREDDRYDGFNPQTSGLIRFHNQRSAFISYHSNLEFLPQHKQRIPGYWWAFGSWGGRVNGPIHAFANVVPSQEYVLEYMTDILANNDAKRIIHGWWGNPDNGNIEEFSRFYAQYRSIPAYDFLDLPGADDPVRVRYCNAENRGFVYLVNQLPNPVQCFLQLERASQLRSTLDGREFPVKENVLTLVLDPYQVLCLSNSAELKPTAFMARPPTTVVAQMNEEFRTLFAKIKSTDVPEEELETLKAVYGKIMTALKAGHYAEFSHLLQSAPIRKVMQVPQE